jgi:hypothetical protein
MFINVYVKHNDSSILVTAHGTPGVLFTSLKSLPSRRVTI